MDKFAPKISVNNKRNQTITYLYNCLINLTKQHSMTADTLFHGIPGLIYCMSGPDRIHDQIEK